MKINNRLFVAGLLILLCSLVKPVAATNPPCSDCEHWDENVEDCVSDCDGSQICCGGSCCSKSCCGDTCCTLSSESCCGESCCAMANVCCNEVCCSSGESCCGSTGSCCDTTFGFCCGPACCDSFFEFCCGGSVCCRNFQECCTGSTPSCAYPCEDDDDETTCSTSNNTDCKACDEGLTDDCTFHITIINQNTKLWFCEPDGCPGDCVPQENVLCSKQYKCKAQIDYMADCVEGWDIPGPLDCYAVMDAVNCKECVPDLDEFIDDVYLPSERCGI